MKSILLISHGKLAEGMYDTLMFFNKEMNNIDYLCLNEGDDLIDFSNKIKRKIAAIINNEGCVVFADLLFGTPCNLAVKILKDENNIDVIAGMNLSIIMEYISLNGKITIEELVQNAKESIVYLNQMINNN